MDFSDIERILELVRDHDLAEFELERDGLKLRVRKAGVPTFHAAPMAPMAPMGMLAPQAPAMSVAAPQPVASLAAAEAAGDEASVDLAVVKSPIVGTFYRSPEPGAASFVEIGDRVKKD